MKRIEFCDATLLNLYKQGDNKAFEKLLLKYKGKVFTTIYLIVKSREVAEDLTQEVFMKVVDTIQQGKYNEEGKFAPWLLRIAHNMGVDYFRKQKRYPEIALEDGTSLFDSYAFSSKSGEQQAIQEELSATIRNLIKELPAPQREVLILRHFAGMSFQEIAEHTGVSINTALGRMRYALINLRKKLQSNDRGYVEYFYPESPY